jgi:exodeoxyribonuclease V gamma subunit
MTKSQIHFSNSLDQLVQVLKENLYQDGSGPFDRRLIAVPHLGLKSYLMQAIAKDPELQVAAGLKIVNLAQAWSLVCRKNLPGALELSLFLEHHLIPLIDQDERLQRYFSTAAWEKRIGPFCDTLAQHFLRYAVYGKKGLSTWQEKLWKAVKQRWAFPSDLPSVKTNWQIHLFGFSFIPKSYFEFFQDATMYLFSPCEIYWEDFYSDKERSFLSIEDEQNPLLGNWGKVGRKMFAMVQESNLITDEHYVVPEGERALQRLQRDCLEGNQMRYPVDESISVYSASTPLREVEVLKDQLLKLGITPRDVQVFAPDIGKYAPFIHATFTDIPYGISDLEAKEVDEVTRAFAKLIALPKNRFSLEDVLQLLSTKPFKEEINTVQAGKWLELAGIHWGFSKNERRTFYLQDVEEEQIAVNSEEGTWQQGLRRLVLGLGQCSGEALCAIEVTEMEQFDRLYTLLYSLSDDLAPLYDGTKWTIPTWLRYFATLLESYFTIDPSHDLYLQLVKLAASCDRLDEEVSYCCVERVLEQLISKKGKTHQPPHLQAIWFSTLKEGCVRPGKVICLLGMQEDIFPQREENSSLYAGEVDYRPKASDLDRYLFLQVLMSAQSHLIIGHLRDETGKLGCSQVVQELMQQLDGAKIVDYPSQPWEYFALKPEPLIKGFYEPIQLAPAVITQREIDIQKLFKFAKHPLRYFLHEKLKIYPENNGVNQKEYLLSPLDKHKLIQKALKSSLDRVLQTADLPINLLKPLAKEQLQKEMDLWNAAIELFGARSSKKIELQVGAIKLVGKLENLTPQGLLVKGKNCIEDRIRFYPQALLGYPLIFLKDQKVVTLEGSLEGYLEYFLRAEDNPSPLLPDFAKALLSGTAADLKKEMQAMEDEAWNWLLPPDAEVIHRNWSSYLKEVMHAAF